MKAVLESLQSYLGRFSEDRKPSEGQKDHVLNAGYGVYGFPPLLIRRAKPKKRNQQEVQVSRKIKWSPSSRCRRSANSEPNLSPSHRNSSPIETVSSPASMVAVRIESSQMPTPLTGLKDCLVKMYSRRVAAKKHHESDQPFDKYTSEYYSRGKKKAQNLQRSACKALDADSTGDVDVSADSSTSDAETSGSSCIEENRTVRVSELSVILAESNALNDNCCQCISEAATNLNRNEDADDAVDAQKMGVNGDNLYSSQGGECDTGFCSQQELCDKLAESSNLSALSLSPARHALRKTFPPPLNMLALQSYSDKRGHYSPEACAASHCLRSFRQDGRIVLQEVRGPIHKYFRVLREDGRLKLELINAVDDLSKDDDETSASDVCIGIPKAGVAAEELHTCNTYAEDRCEGAGAFLVGTHLLSDETSTNEAGSDIECVRIADDHISAYSCNAVVVVTPLEQVISTASDTQNKSKSEPEVGDTTCNLGASTDERMLQCNLIFAKEYGVEDMVSCLNEPATSPRCAETTALYDGPTVTSMKRSWVRSISAF